MRGTHAFRDVVAPSAPLAPRHEVHLDVRDVRAPAHEVMPHQSVEIIRRRDARVDLVIGGLRLGAHGRRDLARGLGGAFERSAFGHVQDDLKLALVVEGQHFHLHPTEPDGGHREQQQRGDRAEEKPAPAGLGDHRPHEAPIQSREEILAVREVASRLRVRGALGEPRVLFAPA